MYKETFITRPEQIDDIGDWLWVETDTGGWNGPANEWKEFKNAWLNQTIGNRKLCIQAGGNQGLYPRLLSEHFDTVITFEPDALNFHCLVHNCSKDNIIKINAAVGDECKFSFLQRADMNNTGMHFMKKEDGMIPMLTIDTLNVPACSFIQLDVEQFEIYVIKGAIKTIEKFHPFISMENGNSQELKNILEPFGYKHIGRTHSDDLWKCS